MKYPKNTKCYKDICICRCAQTHKEKEKERNCFDASRYNQTCKIQFLNTAVRHSELSSRESLSFFVVCAQTGRVFLRCSAARKTAKGRVLNSFSRRRRTGPPTVSRKLYSPADRFATSSLMRIAREAGYDYTDAYNFVFARGFVRRDSRKYIRKSKALKIRASLRCAQFAAAEL